MHLRRTWTPLASATRLNAVKRDHVLAILEHKLNAQRPGFDDALASAITTVHRELGLVPTRDVDLKKLDSAVLRHLYASLVLDTSLWSALLSSKPCGASIILFACLTAADLAVHGLIVGVDRSGKSVAATIAAKQRKTLAIAAPPHRPTIEPVRPASPVSSLALSSSPGTESDVSVPISRRGSIASSVSTAVTSVDLADDKVEDEPAIELAAGPPTFDAAESPALCVRSLTWLR